MQFIRYVILALVALFITSGCESLSTPRLIAPVSDSFSLEQNAYASLRAYAETAQIIADMVEDPQTPETVRLVLATALLNTSGPAEALGNAFAEYSRIKAEIDVRSSQGLPIPVVLVSEATNSYLALQSLWAENSNTILSFPGIVQTLQSSDLAVLGDR